MKTLAELQKMIAGTFSAFPDKKARWKAMQAIQWRLRGPQGQFVGVNNRAQCAFVPENEAIVFDGRDNEVLKLATYQNKLGPLTIEILPQTN